VKKYRRIEITAFRRRVLIVSGKPTACGEVVDVLVNDAETHETIETDSEKGQEIMIEAIRLLEERIIRGATGT